VKPVRLSSAALDELGDAAAWYDEQHPGLGDRFLDDAGRVVAAVQSRPLSFQRLDTPSVDFTIRRALLARFPFAAVFVELRDEWRILAFAHLKRHPEYWLHRLTPPK
jgi:hypothetical protein